MSTQVLLDHDLNANGHRILGARGSDVTIASGLVTLGNGNLFRIIPGAGTGDDELRYITTAGWVAGSVVYLEVTRDEDSIGLTNGGGPPAGAAGLVVSGTTSELGVGQVAVLSFDGDDWKLVNIITGGVSGNFQPIGDGGNLAIANYAITLPAAGSHNFFTVVSGGISEGQNMMGAIVTPSGWLRGTSIFLQAPGAGLEIPYAYEGGVPSGVAFLYPSGVGAPGALTGDSVWHLVFDGTRWHLVGSSGNTTA